MPVTLLGLKCWLKAEQTQNFKINDVGNAFMIVKVRSARAQAENAAFAML